MKVFTTIIEILGDEISGSRKLLDAITKPSMKLLGSKGDNTKQNAPIVLYALTRRLASSRFA